MTKPKNLLTGYITRAIDTIQNCLVPLGLVLFSYTAMQIPSIYSLQIYIFSYSLFLSGPEEGDKNDLRAGAPLL